MHQGKAYADKMVRRVHTVQIAGMLQNIMHAVEKSVPGLTFTMTVILYLAQFTAETIGDTNDSTALSINT